MPSRRADVVKTPQAANEGPCGRWGLACSGGVVDEYAPPAAGRIGLPPDPNERASASPVTDPSDTAENADWDDPPDLMAAPDPNDRAEADPNERAPFTGPEMGALAHLYRGELYRSTVWRTRLDATTNWSVVSLGIALTISYSTPQASPLPLFLVSLLIVVFLYLEARRYRYFNVWRARARWLEINFYAPLLRQVPYHEAPWRDRLAADYERPEHHISFKRALGRRLRRNYLWIFSVQFLAFYGKVFIHPDGVTSSQDVLDRLTFGPLPGLFVGALTIGIYMAILFFTLHVYVLDRQRFAERANPISMG